MCDSTKGDTPRGDSQAENEATAINLDEYEIQWAKSVGYHRHQESERRGLKQSDGSQDQNALRNHQQGAAAELALTKFLKIPWNATVNTYNGFPDLDGYLECRSKQERQQYLRLHPKRDTDKGAAVFVSVTCTDSGLKTFRIDGWILGSVAMQPKYLKTNRWGKTEWEPPLSDLQPPATLKKELDDRLRVVNTGRDKMREWVRATFQKEADRP
jgi:hypothetical protein